MGRRQFDQENNRLEYGQLLFPEPGYDLEFAVGMTYSLDLEALLGIPVSLGMLETLDSAAAKNPYFVLEAIRKSSDRIALFCNFDGMKLPQNIRPVFALLEGSVFPISLGQNANFHPKLWVVCYRNAAGEKRIRVIVLSRNLTFDCSMDVAAEMTGTVGKERCEANRPLADLLYFTATHASREKKPAIQALARDVMRVSDFDCGERFESYEFLPFGIPGHKQETDRFLLDADNLLVVSPFLSKGVLEKITRRPWRKTLITRKASLTPEIVRQFDHIYVPREELMDDELLGEADTCTKRDLHAKVMGKANSSGNYLYLGSLNASHNALYRNVEFLLGLKFKPYMASYDSLVKDFLPEENNPFEEVTQVEEISEEESTEQSVLRGIAGLLRGAVVHREGDSYRVTLDCDAPEAPATLAPLLRKEQARPIAPGLAFEGLLLRELSEFYIVWCGEERAVLKITTEGIPEERDQAIYSSIIGSKQGFLAYVSFLLADDYVETGLEQHDLQAMLRRGDPQSAGNDPSAALYERLLQAAVYQPQKLAAVESLMAKIDPALVTDDFRALLALFQKAIGKRRQP